MRRPGQPALDPLDPAHLATLLATGEHAPPLDEKLVLARVLRASVRDGGMQLDRALLERIARLDAGVRAAEAAHTELRALVERLAAPPWHPALFLRAIDTPLGRRAMVLQTGGRRVVAVGEDVDLDALTVGEEVLLAADGSVVAGRSPYGVPPYGETASFERILPDGRCVLRSRDEEVVVDVAGTLDAVALGRGDLVRWDRDAWMAFERLETGVHRDAWLTDVPDLDRRSVGGQDANLDLVLSALTGWLVAPAMAAAYGLGGRQAMIFEGPPGCGKTLLAQVAAAEVARIGGRRCRFAVVKPAEWDDPYVGVTGQRIRACFAALARAADEDGYAVLFLDEIEAIGRIRGGTGNLHGDKFLASLLVELDGFAAHANVAVIAATNRCDLLDAALRSRFELEIAVGRPTLAGARAIFALHFPASLPLADPAAGRDALVETAVSLLYAPNTTDVATLTLRDGTTRVVAARELVSGRLFAQVCRSACRRAYLRELRGGPAGVRITDVEHAVEDALARLAATLSVRNVYDQLADLAPDADVMRVTPIATRSTASHRYERAA